MPAPILVHAREVVTLEPYLREKLPGETILAVGSDECIDAALARNPDCAFMIQNVRLGQEAQHRVRDHPSVAWIQVGGSGYEWLGEWDRDRLTVTNGMGVLAPFLAETVIAAILSLNFGFPRYAEAQRAHAWRPGLFPPLAGQRLLVVGAGAIGRETAKRARTLGMAVTGLNRSGEPVEGMEDMRPIAEIDALLPEADVVSCHLRMTEETRHFFDAHRFALMKPGALFLNSARGGCVDEAALEGALTEGPLRGAWCDVFKTEPLPAESPLWDLPNLIVTPHCSDGIAGWEFKFADMFIANLARWRAGEAMINRVG